MLDDWMHGPHKIGIGLELARLHARNGGARGRREVERHDDDIEGKQETHDGRGAFSDISSSYAIDDPASDRSGEAKA